MCHTKDDTIHLHHCRTGSEWVYVYIVTVQAPKLGTSSHETIGFKRSAMVVCHRILQPYRSESAVRFGSADVGDSGALVSQPGG